MSACRAAARRCLRVWRCANARALRGRRLPPTPLARAAKGTGPTLPQAGPMHARTGRPAAGWWGIDVGGADVRSLLAVHVVPGVACGVPHCAGARLAACTPQWRCGKTCRAPAVAGRTGGLKPLPCGGLTRVRRQAALPRRLAANFACEANVYRGRCR